MVDGPALMDQGQRLEGNSYMDCSYEERYVPVPHIYYYRNCEVLSGGYFKNNKGAIGKIC